MIPLHASYEDIMGNSHAFASPVPLKVRTAPHHVYNTSVAFVLLALGLGR